MATRRGWGIRVLNMQDAVDAFRDAESAFGATNLKLCLMAIAIKVRDRAKQFCPVGTGRRPSGKERPHLRDLIFAAPGKENSPSVIVGVDRKKAPHAHLVELGHGGPHPAPAHPYLRPAFDALKASAKSIMGQQITERIIKKLKSRKRRA